MEKIKAVPTETLQKEDRVKSTVLAYFGTFRQSYVQTMEQKHWFFNGNNLHRFQINHWDLDEKNQNHRNRLKIFQAWDGSKTGALFCKKLGYQDSDATIRLKQFSNQSAFTNVQVYS